MDESPANPVLAGALVGGLYGGAQTAINGGSFSEVLKAAAIGAVTGAIGGAIGGPLGEVAGEVSGALGGGVAGEVAGAVVHAAAHGVVGGLTSMAMGGTFQDGFIGSAIGAGVTSALGAMPGMSALEGKGVLKVIGRTAVAAISGGVASVLAGGKFADGAYSAAFFHLFNDETHRIAQEARLDAMLRDDRTRKIFLINRREPGDATINMASGETMWRAATEVIGGASYLDISTAGWEAELSRLAGSRGVDIIGIFDHGSSGDQWFNGYGNLTPGSCEWRSVVASVKYGGRVLLCGCNVASGDKGAGYIRSLAGTSVAYQKSLIVTGMSTRIHSPSATFEGSGVQVSSQYRGQGNFMTIYTRYEPQFTR